MKHSVKLVILGIFFFMVFRAGVASGFVSWRPTLLEAAALSPHTVEVVFGWPSNGNLDEEMGGALTSYHLCAAPIGDGSESVTVCKNVEALATASTPQTEVLEELEEGTDYRITVVPLFGEEQGQTANNKPMVTTGVTGMMEAVFEDSVAFQSPGIQVNVAKRIMITLSKSNVGGTSVNMSMDSPMCFFSVADENGNILGDSNSADLNSADQEATPLGMHNSLSLSFEDGEDIYSALAVYIFCSSLHDASLGGNIISLEEQKGQSINIFSSWQSSSLNVHDVPSAPTLVSGVSFSKSTAMVTFRPSLTDSNAPIEEYRIYYMLEGEDQARSQSVGSQDRLASLSGLQTVPEQNFTFCKVWATAVNFAGESPASLSDNFKLGAAGCPTDTDDVFGDVALFNTEDHFGMEQLTVMVPYNLGYQDFSSVEIQFGQPSCSSCLISATDTIETLDCALVFPVPERCSGNWGIARFNLLLAELQNTEEFFCGFDVSSSGSELEYSISLIATANLKLQSLFDDVEDLERMERWFRTIQVLWPATVAAHLELGNIYGIPLKEIFPSSSVNVMLNTHDLSIVTRTQYPYAISSARLWKDDDPLDVYALIIADYDCSDLPDGSACEQYLTLSSSNTNFPVPGCSETVDYSLELTMSCPAIDFDCIDITGGGFFSISTNYCPALHVTADNIHAELNTFSGAEIDPETGNYVTVGSESSLFVYLNTIYYEMTLTGLTGADVQMSSFHISLPSEPSVSTTTFDIQNTLVEPEYGEGLSNIPTVNILKPFGVEPNKDSIIFKHIVNEYTFPNYPENDPNAVTSYLVSCTVQNYGFSRRLEAHLKRVLTVDNYGASESISIFWAIDGDVSSATRDSILSEEREGNDLNASNIFQDPVILIVLVASPVLAIGSMLCIWYQCWYRKKKKRTQDTEDWPALPETKTSIKPALKTQKGVVKDVGDGVVYRLSDTKDQDNLTGSPDRRPHQTPGPLRRRSSKNLLRKQSSSEDSPVSCSAEEFFQSSDSLDQFSPSELRPHQAPNISMKNSTKERLFQKQNSFAVEVWDDDGNPQEGPSGTSTPSVKNREIKKGPNQEIELLEEIYASPLERTWPASDGLSQECGSSEKCAQTDPSDDQNADKAVLKPLQRSSSLPGPKRRNSPRTQKNGLWQRDAVEEAAEDDDPPCVPARKNVDVLQPGPKKRGSKVETGGKVLLGRSASCEDRPSSSMEPPPAPPKRSTSHRPKGPTKRRSKNEADGSFLSAAERAASVSPTPKKRR